VRERDADKEEEEEDAQDDEDGEGEGNRGLVVNGETVGGREMAGDTLPPVTSSRGGRECAAGIEGNGPDRREDGAEAGAREDVGGIERVAVVDAGDDDDAEGGLTT